MPDFMPESMQGIMKEEEAVGLTLQTLPVPEPGWGEVLVRVQAASICGTDLHIYRWDPWARSRIIPPLVIGHEFSGQVQAIGPGVTRVEEGDWVTAEGHITCGHCFYCRTGEGHICKDVRILGVDRPGCFAHFVLLPQENIWVTHHLSPELVSIMDPLGNAVHACSMVQLMGQVVVITGCGPIGLCAVALARMGGARFILASDPIPYRLELASCLGAHQVILAGEEDLQEVVLEETQGHGAHILLEMSGHPQAINAGLAALSNGGEAVLLGLPSQQVELDLGQDVIFKGVTLYGINGRRMFSTWYQMSSLLEAGLSVLPIITHHYSFQQYEEAFQTGLSGNCGKIILYPEGEGKGRD